MRKKKPVQPKPRVLNPYVYTRKELKIVFTIFGIMIGIILEFIYIILFV